MSEEALSPVGRLLLRLEIEGANPEGAPDCPHGDPLHFHHDGCPSCETA